MPDFLDVTLSSDEIGALCDRLELSVPGPLATSELPASHDPGREQIFDRALVRLAERGVVVDAARGTVEPEAMRSALTLLSSPETLINMQRRDSIAAGAACIALSGEVAAEHRLLGNQMHRIRLFKTDQVVSRTTGFCGLLDRPVHELAGFTVTPAQLRQVVDLMANGDDAKGTAVLAGSDHPDESKAMFLRALASRPAAAHVTVLTRRGDCRVEGTVTAWLDGGEAGLWHIPPIKVSRSRSDDLDERALHDTVLMVRPTSKAELIDEITEGFAELRSS